MPLLLSLVFAAGCIMIANGSQRAAVGAESAPIDELPTWEAACLHRMPVPANHDEDA